MVKFVTVDGDEDTPYAVCPHTKLPLSKEVFVFANEGYFSPEAAYLHQQKKRKISDDEEKSTELAKAILSVMYKAKKEDITQEQVDQFEDLVDGFTVKYEAPQPAANYPGMKSVEDLYDEYQAKKEEKGKDKDGGEEEKKSNYDLHIYHLQGGLTHARYFGVSRGGSLRSTMDDEDEAADLEELAEDGGMAFAVVDNKAQQPVILVPLDSNTSSPNYLLEDTLGMREKGDFIVISGKRVPEFLTKKTEKSARKRDRETKKASRLAEKEAKKAAREAKKAERAEALIAKEKRKADRAAAKAAKEASGESSSKPPAKPRNRKKAKVSSEEQLNREE